MRSNVAVGPPIDLLVYANDDLAVRRYRRLSTSDPDLLEVRSNWERELRRAVGMLPQIDFGPPPSGTDLGPTT
jgi:putative proteasome-type protease